MFERYSWALILAVSIVPISTISAQERRTFSLPDSVLLFAEPYQDLTVVGPGGTEILRPPVDVKANSGEFARPSIAPNGDLVSWGFVIANDDSRARLVRFALGIYSTSDHKWRTYGDFDMVTATSFSPDGSRIAFTANARGSDKRDLSILELETGKIRRIKYLAAVQPSWSPDGKKLAVNIQRGFDKDPILAVIDIDSGNMNTIAEGGGNPAWSPSGEWIAYIVLSGERCMLVHPDGTGSKIVSEAKSTFFTYRRFGYAVVWSPDSRKLLLNKLTNALGKLDAVLVDIETGRSTTKLKNSVPVFGWVSRGK
jgi:Tol biopolymer transport system component